MLRNKIKRLEQYARNGIRELRGAVVIRGSVAIGYDGKPIASNWGDDINYHMLRSIIASPVVMYGQAPLARIFGRPHYVVIGSIIGTHTDRNSIIWGAGIMDSTLLNIEKPRRICAVRGPMTRRKLIDMGIDCPEVYGDPALLLPDYYSPKPRRRYRLGVIPHYVDFKRAKEILSGQDDIQIIDIRHYGECWTDFIDHIAECDAIASSSLHGLIVATAYGIPSAWVEFYGAEKRDSFKYHDFYASLTMPEDFVIEPQIIINVQDLDYIIPILGKSDTTPLRSAAPFKLRPPHIPQKHHSID